MNTIRYIGWVAGLFILCGVLLVFAHLSTDDLDFSRYNRGWNGTSAFFEDAKNAVLVEDLESLEQYSNATCLIIAPARNYTSDDISLYRSFLGRGNLIVIFDDFGSGGTFLEGIGSRIRISGISLASADHSHENVSLVRVYPEGNAPLFANVSSLTLDRPTKLDGGEPFLVTSFLTWGDTNGDFKLNKDEVVGRHVVGARERLGAGEVIVIGDPSILINGMEGEDPDRDLFIRDLFTLRSYTLIDMTNSRTAESGSIGRFINMIQKSTLIQTIVLIAMVAAVAVIFRRINHRGSR